MLIRVFRHFFPIKKLYIIVGILIEGYIYDKQDLQQDYNIFFRTVSKKQKTENSVAYFE